MEELFVCAILCGLGLEKYDIYREKLEQLLELNPSDEILTLYQSLEDKYGKDLQFRADPSIHIEEFKLIDPVTGDSLD